MRQDHVKEDLIRTGGVNASNDQRSPIKRTFAEAKQTLPEYDDSPSGMGYMSEQMYMEPMYNENSFLEVDEEEPYQQSPPQYCSKNYSASDSKVRYDEEDKPKIKVGGHTIRSAESFLNDSLPEYSHPDEPARYSRKERPRRRRSRELTENEMFASSNDDEPKRKPETMRSISEDVPCRNVKPITRRSLSHPEKETQVGICDIWSLYVRCTRFPMQSCWPPTRPR